MKTQRELIALCLLLTTAGVGSAQSDRTADRKEIENDYARVARALKQNDSKPLLSLMTQDATFKEADGSLTPRSQFEAMMKQMANTMTYTQMSSKVTKWMWRRNAALLDVTIKSAGKIKTPDGKAHLVTYVSKSRDAWVKQADGWRLQQIEAVSETMTRDGKPVVMPTPAPKK